MTPTSAERSAEALVDTSVAVAVIAQDHEAHAATIAAVRGLRLGLAGHAWFETYSVLTRLPGTARRAPADVTRALAHNFPATRFLGGGAAERLTHELAAAGLAGGSTYDALVAAAARQHGLPLLTRDRRALPVYRALDAVATLLA